MESMLSPEGSGLRLSRQRRFCQRLVCNFQWITQCHAPVKGFDSSVPVRCRARIPGEALGRLSPGSWAKSLDMRLPYRGNADSRIESPDRLSGISYWICQGKGRLNMLRATLSAICYSFRFCFEVPDIVKYIRSLGTRHEFWILLWEAWELNIVLPKIWIDPMDLCILLLPYMLCIPFWKCWDIPCPGGWGCTATVKQPVWPRDIWWCMLLRVTDTATFTWVPPAHPGWMVHWDRWF